MTITTRHPAADPPGTPVILGDDGRPLDPAAGLRAVLARLGWDRRRLAAETGCSVRTVEGWFQGRLRGRPVEARVLNVLRDALDARPRGRDPGGEKTTPPE